MTQQKFEFEGARDLATNLEGAATLIKGELNKALRKIGKMMVPALKQNTPRAAGKLANSTRFQITGSPADQKLEIRQGARTPAGDFYGSFVRLGTKPHEIRPVNAKALAFTIGNKLVFAKVVKHPGTKANPYHVDTLKEKQSEIQAVVTDAGINVAAKITR
jgi:hypothetical protein|tara:strand:+ start:1105 stop:1587 length:483 start_codon:yes stop_codon:yes gene_type:complete